MTKRKDMPGINDDPAQGEREAYLAELGRHKEDDQFDKKVLPGDTHELQGKTHAGLPVYGYKPQSDDAVRAVNYNKQLEETLLRVLDGMSHSKDVDQRWLAIGRTHIEEAFMCINRSIFKPERIKIEPRD